MDNCRFCQSDKLIRAGFIHSVQRYICKLCKKTQLEIINRQKCDFDIKLKAIALSHAGKSLRDIASELDVSSTSVFRWLKNSQKILLQALEQSINNKQPIKIKESEQGFCLVIDI